MKILVTPTSMQPDRRSSAIDRLREFTDDIVFNPTGKPLEEDDLIPLLADCDGYIAGVDNVTAKVMDACPKLKVISRYGVGCDRVDTAAAAARDIAVTNTPGANSEAVGELAFALILSIARCIPYLNETTRGGQWVRSSGIELKGKTLGILGLGAIGRAVARCASGFEMKVIAYDPYMNVRYCEEHGIGNCSFDEVIERADVISLHLPLTDETRHMIGRDQFEKMRDQVILINASRGGIIDEDAAYEALKSGKVFGMGLDAFETEPPAGSKLFEFSNVVATPHTGAHTKEATGNMANMAVDNLIDVLSGRECRYIVNRQ